VRCATRAGADIELTNRVAEIVDAPTIVLGQGGGDLSITGILSARNVRTYASPRSPAEFPTHPQSNVTFAPTLSSVQANGVLAASLSQASTSELKMNLAGVEGMLDVYQGASTLGTVTLYCQVISFMVIAFGGGVGLPVTFTAATVITNQWDSGTLTTTDGNFVASLTRYGFYITGGDVVRRPGTSHLCGHS
jgi:hypothetical protein